ncbi:MAG: hypothetical protein V7K48_11830 [Nostoc sp.]|uniref:hypothetical protein n=1 Tax=Nostoc sp. TaxID=1180 RepID=UPI002FF9942A
MLKSYKGLTDEMKLSSARVIVTIFEEITPLVKRRTPPAAIAGKNKILGDLVSSIVEEQHWNVSSNCSRHSYLDLVCLLKNSSYFRLTGERRSKRLTR